MAKSNGSYFEETSFLYVYLTVIVLRTYVRDTMTEVEIEYCVPCGLLDNAVKTQQELLEEYGRELEAVSLVPGHGGVFKVRVDGDLVFDKDDKEGGYDLDAIRAAVHDQVGAPA